MWKLSSLNAAVPLSDEGVLLLSTGCAGSLIRAKADGTGATTPGWVKGGGVRFSIIIPQGNDNLALPQHKPNTTDDANKMPEELRPC